MNNNALQEAAEKYAGSNYNRNHFPKSWNDRYTAFIDGAQYHQQQQVGPVWVKASERLPKVDKMLPVWFPVTNEYSVMHSDDIRSGRNGFYYYWLDESKVLSDEEIDRLAKNEFPTEAVYTGNPRTEAIANSNIEASNHTALRQQQAFIKGYKAAKGML